MDILLMCVFNEFANMLMLVNEHIMNNYIFMLDHSALTEQMQLLIVFMYF